MDELANKKCKPCEGGVDPLEPAQASSLLGQIDKEWALCDGGKSIARSFSFKMFSRTIAFTNAVAWVATTEGHHPQMTVNYGSCEVLFTTNAIGGLSDNDFICAAKVDRLFAGA